MQEINKIEEKILEFWKKNKTFEKSLEKTKKCKPYIFYDGPPFATGLPHYGHILASVIKDAVPRFWTMNNRYVKRVWGWDCHGLPIENITEKVLGIKTKDEIEKIGVKKFNKFCRSEVLAYVSEWKKTINRIARWVEFDNSYKTMDNDYIESVWWAFKELYDRGFIYEGEKILMYCPRCETPLSKSEVGMDNSYKTIKDKAITVIFKIKERFENKEVFALAWTTTPWTLPSNLALTVNPDLYYVYLQDNVDGRIYLLGEDSIVHYFKSSDNYKILKKVRGKDLIGHVYEPLFPYFGHLKNSFRIIPGDFVKSKDGTSIVHTAPAFGEDDYTVSKKNGIDIVSPIDNQGRFTEEVLDFAGMKTSDSNPKIIEHLKNKGRIIKVESIEHEYPFCYRCETALIYRAIPSWFINIQKIKQKLLKLNQKIKWHPGFLKDGRVHNNIENAPDWNISRNRYWASAIPIWRSESGKIKVIGSIKELKRYAISFPKGKIDLHKDFLDSIILRVEGEEYKRIPEVLDCWVESASMTFAQFHYPFENKVYFEKNFPAQFVAEYIAQTRTWFYYMMVISSILFGKIPFENVMTTGTILAEDGSKMSKSKRNFTDPHVIINKYGADALRFYLLSSPVMNADNINFSEKGVEEIYKKVIMLIYNVNNFYSLNKTKETANDKSKNVIDIWIISRLNQLIENFTFFMQNYNIIKACNEIRIFIDDLSTWYVRKNRDRFNENDLDALKTLKFVLIELSKVMAPIMPFVSEEIWHNVVNEKESVHLKEWPKSGKIINMKILENMQIVRDVVSLGLRERDKEKLSLKQPLSKAIVHLTDINKEYLEIIKEELNVKSIEIKKDKVINVKLDTIITPELEAEGYAREISRKVQAARKKARLVKTDKIKLGIFVDISLVKIIESQKNLIKERTNSKEILINEIGKINEKYYKEKFEDKIKNKNMKILFRKL